MIAKSTSTLFIATGHGKRSATLSWLYFYTFWGIISLKLAIAEAERSV
jgi:hypothetical protein